MEAIPVAHDLFTLGTEPRLIAGRHVKSGRLVFPLPTEGDYERVALPTRGVLWSHTVQRFAPKSPPYAGPAPFEPFALGYVALAEALIVESRLTDVAFDQLRIGLPMELTTLVLRYAPDGALKTTFAFRPSQES